MKFLVYVSHLCLFFSRTVDDSKLKYKLDIQTASWPIHTFPLIVLRKPWIFQYIPYDPNLLVSQNFQWFQAPVSQSSGCELRGVPHLHEPSWRLRAIHHSNHCTSRRVWKVMFIFFGSLSITFLGKTFSKFMLVCWISFNLIHVQPEFYISLLVATRSHSNTLYI